MLIPDPKKERPPTLYKYCPPERIDILEGLRVRFTPPSDFNDAFDSYNPVPPGSRFHVMVRRSELRDRLGVLCLTEKADSQLMWVHYAGRHTGFVLGLNASAQFFQAEGSVLDFVIYEPTPHDAPEERACFYKSKDWRYEEEWRCTRNFEESKSRLVPIEPDLITEIVFGWKMESSNVTRIVRTATNWHQSPAFFESAPSIHPLRFVNTPKDIALCHHCSGKGYLRNRR